MRPFLVLALALATLLASLGLATPASAAEAAVKVAIIVGPVGEELTPVYLDLAEQAADAAESRGATVAKAYSPDATPEKVLAAVEHANIVVYLGHGVGSPNPYSDTPSAATTNGWGLTGPNADGSHADSAAAGSLAYYGEAWIAAHAEPAPGWVMIYSNACYAPGAGEGFEEPASEKTAAARVSAYSRAPLTELGASAYFATDFYAGAAHLVATLLDDPTLPYGAVFASDPRYSADGVVDLAHASVAGAVTRLQRSPYFAGKADYWYAFAGDPAGSLSSGIAAAAPLPVLDAATAPATGFGTQRTLYPARQLILPPGPVEGVSYTGDGAVLGRIALTLDAPLVVSAYAIGLVNGVEQVLIGDGDLAGTWVPTTRVARIGA